METAESAIFTNICLITDDAGNILVQDRKNPNWPGIAFPGGHVEKEESFVDAVIREVLEETGLTVENPILCGVKQWPGPQDARCVVLFYKATRFTGTLRSSEEGEVFWVSREELHRYPLARDFEEMLRLMEDDTKSEFFYYKDNGTRKYRLL